MMPAICACADSVPYQPIAGPMRCHKCFKELPMEMAYVCKRDGVLVGASRAGALVHLDEIPAGIGDHEIETISEAQFASWATKRRSLVDAASDMLAHHNSICPASACNFAERLLTSLRSTS